MLLLAHAQSARHALPEVPPFRPALRCTRMPGIRPEHAPEAVHAQIVAGITEAGAKQEPGQVEPARLVLRTSRARRLERPKHVPPRADRRQRPRIATGIQPGL